MSKYSNIHLHILVSILCLTFCSCKKSLLKEGDSCQVNNQIGICTAVDKCWSANMPGRNLYDFATCSIKHGTIIICCPKGENTKPVKDPITKKEIRKTGQKAWDKCLDYLRDVDYSCKAIFQTKSVRNVLKLSYKTDLPKQRPQNKLIAGGRNAKVTQFPHMALLGYGNEKTLISWVCGGTLISDKFILTAAHCMQYNGLQVRHIALGIVKRSDVQRSERYLVQRIILHPEYRSPTTYNDIALLETTQRVIFTPNVLPACLAIPDPPYRSSTLRHKGFAATGWGYLGQSGIMADNLQVVYLKEYDYQTCKQFYSYHRYLPDGLNSTTQFCFGDVERSKDTCTGDSGGPLQIAGQASDCQYSIIGVTSIGNKCPSQAGLYTRVQPYISWIESIVWP